MSLIALGINHKTAKVGLREKLTFSAGTLSFALNSLQTMAVSESVILSTCNRTELYCSLENTCNENELITWLAHYHELAVSDIKEHVYVHKAEQAVSHLMRVACGLDSLVLGEPQILGQLKQAFFEARDVGAISSSFEKLFQLTFSTAKRVRSETEIGANAVSVAFAAVSLAKHIFSDLKQSTVLLIGAGETIELAARHLVEQGVKKILVANRTQQRAMQLAESFSGEPLSLPDIPAYLHKADIIISSTGSPLPILGKGMLESALKKRKYQPMLLIDIAVPRDIEAQVNELSDVYLYSIDDLQELVQNNIESRQVAAKHAEQIVCEQQRLFLEWQASLLSIDILKQYREQSEAVRDALVAKALNQLEKGNDAEKVIKQLASTLTNKLIHAPTTSLAQASKDGLTEQVELLARSLGLDEHHQL